MLTQGALALQEVAVLILSEYAMQPVLELAPTLKSSTGSPLRSGEGYLR